MNEGRKASGFPCPECGTSGEHALLEMQALHLQLHCLGCEATWWAPMTECEYGDPTCPCQDGDSCHYEDVTLPDGTVSKAMEPPTDAGPS